MLELHSQVLGRRDEIDDAVTMRVLLFPGGLAQSIDVYSYEESKRRKKSQKVPFLPYFECYCVSYTLKIQK